jgi:6-pyruvoyltetrahydropterin/6-carboxytetrahydropterin synthase
MISVTKAFTFDAAHFLPSHRGDCKRLHGHTYKLEVTVTRKDGLKPINDEGMVVDFSQLKKVVNKEIIDRVDHELLNNILTEPTAENLLCWMNGRLTLALFNYTFRVVRLRLWETPDSYAEVTIK